jgi:hypothetical protein
MRDGDEGIGVDLLKELDPGPSTHDGIHVDVDHGSSYIYYELGPPLQAVATGVSPHGGMSSCPMCVNIIVWLLLTCDSVLVLCLV